MILAPHLTRLTKQAVGLPVGKGDRTSTAGRDVLEGGGELYNGGLPFKITCRDESGVMVTIIADNYYGYCKKEVKTQISFAANLFGLCEEEHAGGALVFPRYDLGEDFSGELHVKPMAHTFAEVLTLFGTDRSSARRIWHRPAVSRHPLCARDAHFDLHAQRISWVEKGGMARAMKLLPGQTYVRPSGYKVHLEKPRPNRSWRLVGTVAEGMLCHKPCTVSGGGKSEISKPITDAILTGPVFVADFKKDFDGGRGTDPARLQPALSSDRTASINARSLSAERFLGSVIKLLTPDERDYKPDTMPGWRRCRSISRNWSLW